ncbi:hybrid sensor histidine kinase/response regulator [Paludisphaera mucosa]|uniref:histidine kinase n=1 Tax=Paludisphaera mucosa TaxID=3030827 RepID=A0ABT6FLD0_9BACT|nr:PAS domain-containing protein [Paludisphaera mucosa]
MTLSAIGDAVLTTDPDGVVTYMNPVAESLTGWSAAEAAGQRLEVVFRIVNEETRKPSEQPVRKVIDTGLVRGLANHTLLITRDGRELAIDDSAAPVWGEGGELVGVVMVFRDVTERRLNEHLVDTARNFAESIISTVREPLLVLNADLHVKSANRSFYETFRVAPSETEGRFIYDLGDGQWDIPALRTLLEEVIPRDSTFNDFEVEHDFEDVGRKTMLLNARRFPPEGKWDLILLAIADVTERRRLDREREAMLLEAEAARTKAEATAVKLAEADLHKNQFLAMLAHELRNPLAAVRNAVEVASRSGSREDLEWSRDVTARQVGNFSHLINDLLDVARITEGKILLRKELIDAAQVALYAVAAVKPIVEERKHELLLSFTSTDLKLEADSTRLEQILVNLLTNAAKYTPAGGHIQLIVGVEGGDVVFRVRDDGLGIAPELLPRMFDLFTQADRSLDRSEGGLGIGLTLVRSLAELHGGNVTATSDGPGEGSEFVVRLPASEARTEAASEANEEPEASTARRFRVLVVDDNVDTADGMAMLLKLSGHDARVAHSAESALDVARDFLPEVMLLDIGLPGMNGYELASAFRGLESSKGSVLIAVSGYGEPQARDRSKEAGFDHHLVKPASFDAVLALLGDV